jgi:hypothetical protein
MKLFITWFSPTSRRFVSLGSKYLAFILIIVIMYFETEAVTLAYRNCPLLSKVTTPSGKQGELSTGALKGGLPHGAQRNIRTQHLVTYNTKPETVYRP